MGTSPVTAITGIFGAVQEARAARESIRILKLAQEQAMAQAGRMEAMFTPFVQQGSKYLTQAGDQVAESQRVLQEQAAGIEVGNGLTTADEIAYKDAARLLNENMVGTGNLRSGAAAFGQTELLRRVVADANQRNFDRRAMKLQLLYGGTARAADQYGQLGSVASQIGLQGQQLSSQLFQNALGYSRDLSGAEINKGRALSNEIVSYGVAADEIKDTAREAWGDFLGGVSAFGGAMGGAGKMMGGM